MGWSDGIVRPEINAIFKKLKKKYRFSWVSAPYPQVRISHEGTIPVATMIQIVDLFPDTVYVEFVAKTEFNGNDDGDTYDYK